MSSVVIGLRVVYRGRCISVVMTLYLSVVMTLCRSICSYAARERLQVYRSL